MTKKKRKSGVGANVAAFVVFALFVIAGLWLSAQLWGLYSDWAGSWPKLGVFLVWFFIGGIEIPILFIILGAFFASIVASRR